MAQPGKAEEHPDQKMAVILFADLMNSTLLADVLEFTEYTKIIARFHKVAIDLYKKLFYSGDPLADPFTHVFEDNDDISSNVCSDKLTDGKVFNCIGDEIKLIITYDEDDKDDPQAKCRAINNALRYSRLLKLTWLCDEWNSKRIENGKRPFDVGIGINVGKVYIRGDMGSQTVEGHAIVLAKRVEGHSREGNHTRIMLSRYAYKSALEAESSITYTSLQGVDLKGLLNKEYICEVKLFLGYIYWDRVEKLWESQETYKKLYDFDCSNTWLGIEIATVYYYLGDFTEALNILQVVLRAEPNSPLALLLQGDIYLDLALDSHDVKCKEFYFNRCKDSMEKAYALETNEDIIIQKALYHLAYAASKEIPGKKPPDKDEIEEASDLLKKAIISRGRSERAVFWAWITDIVLSDYKNYDPRSLLVQAGWIDDLGISEEKLKDTVINHAEEYCNKIYLDNYLANVQACVGVVCSDMFETPDLKQAEQWFGKAIKLASSLKTPSKGRIYASKGIVSCLVKPQDFINVVNSMAEMLKLSKKIISS